MIVVYKNCLKCKQTAVKFNEGVISLNISVLSVRNFEASSLYYLLVFFFVKSDLTKFLWIFEHHASTFSVLGN